MVLSALIGSAFIASFSTVIGASAGITSASFTLVFFIKNGIAKKRLKTMKRSNARKILSVAKSKSNSVDNIISKALKINKISHEGFTIIIKKERNYRELK